ncbi:MAG: UDP-N-acetylglucosamine 1-carboxyvinyltransferase [Kiritimatiellia bacterium]|nr:UDP-N-acetylglucosamine 1-carboxyvinyltransferase [Kiritimatiellia bacterium]
MARLIINGRHRVGGLFQPSGNKNAVLPMLAASLLTEDKIVLHNVPVIQDVLTMLAILEDLGVSIDRRGGTLALCAASIRKKRLKSELCARVRSSILFAGPMAARHGRVTIYPPGGDVIGRRRLDSHFIGLRALGIEIAGSDHFTFRAKKLRGGKILLDEASVTATENVIMAATLAGGQTTIFNAACEPHVQDLCFLLNKMGAKISGLGTNLLRIEGVAELHGAEHRVSQDYIEIGSFLAAAAVTGGELTIHGIDESHIAPILRPFHILGADLRLENKTLKLVPLKNLKLRVEHDLAIPKIEDGPWPAFPSDLMSIAIVLGTQTTGTALFFEKMFESRMYFVERLIDMGAKIVQCDPHRVVVIGPSRLHAIPLSSPDIRAGMAMLIAALGAKGTSVIHNAEVIDRGYERIEERLRALGADINREK